VLRQTLRFYPIKSLDYKNQTHHERQWKNRRKRVTEDERINEFGFSSLIVAVKATWRADSFFLVATVVARTPRAGVLSNVVML
jgi:hypothetical protein